MKPLTLLVLLLLCTQVFSKKVENSSLINPDSLSVNTKKSFIICDIGFLVGTVENEMKTPLSFITACYIPVYKALHFGLGTGLEFYQMTYLPAIAELRIKISDIGLSYYFQAGFAFPISEKSRLPEGEFKFRTAYLINPGISYTFPTSHQAAFTISVSYRYQKNKSDLIGEPTYYYHTDYQLINEMNRFNIRLGYTFK